MNLKGFLNFERMVTPVIIKILFWIGLIVSMIAALGIVLGGIITGIRDSNLGIILAGLVGGSIVLILSVLAVRIYAELLILAFRINETLTDIKNLLNKEK